MHKALIDYSDKIKTVIVFKSLIMDSFKDLSLRSGHAVLLNYGPIYLKVTCGDQQIVVKTEEVNGLWDLMTWADSVYI